MDKMFKPKSVEEIYSRLGVENVNLALRMCIKYDQPDVAMHVIKNNNIPDNYSLVTATDVIASKLARKSDEIINGVWDYTMVNSVFKLSASNGCTNFMEFCLSKGAEVEHTSKSGRTALHFAVRTNKKATQYLLNLGANIEATDEKGNTPLLATRIPMIAELLLNNGANPHVENIEGDTPITKNPGLIPLFIKNNITVEPEAIIKAIVSKSPGLIKMFVDKGIIDPNKKLLGKYPYEYVPTKGFIGSYKRRILKGSELKIK